MNKLDEARREIDEADRELARIFERRMRAAREIAAYKAGRGLPVPDPAREEAVLKSRGDAFENEELAPYYIGFMKDVMKHSRAYQEDLMNGVRVAFCGVEGAWAYIAAKKIFPAAQTVSFGDFESAYRAVEASECTLAVLPLENSTAGEVGQVTDMLFNGTLLITGTYDLPVRHALLGVKGAKKEDIRRVVSHPQALAQCGEYLKETGWEITSFANTAMAARSVAEKGDPTVAAIASPDAARLYGLEVLENSVNEEAQNTTRFAVLSRAAASPGGKDARSALTFTVKNEAGSLAKAIGIIGSHGFNMLELRSRPMKELTWQYYFFAELEGKVDSPEGEAMLSDLSECCDKLKHLGSYVRRTLD